MILDATWAPLLRLGTSLLMHQTALKQPLSMLTQPLGAAPLPLPNNKTSLSNGAAFFILIMMLLLVLPAPAVFLVE